MPRCLLSGSVRAPHQYHSAKWAEVVHVFWPLSSQPVDAVLGGVLHGLEPHRRGVGTGVGLGVADGELDVVLEDHRQELVLQEVASRGR